MITRPWRGRVTRLALNLTAGRLRAGRRQGRHRDIRFCRLSAHGAIGVGAHAVAGAMPTSQGSRNDARHTDIVAGDLGRGSRGLCPKVQACDVEVALEKCQAPSRPMSAPVPLTAWDRQSSDGPLEVRFAVARAAVVAEIKADQLNGRDVAPCRRAGAMLVEKGDVHRCSEIKPLHHLWLLGFSAEFLLAKVKQAVEHLKNKNLPKRPGGATYSFGSPCGLRPNALAA